MVHTLKKSPTARYSEAKSRPLWVTLLKWGLFSVTVWVAWELGGAKQKMRYSEISDWELILDPMRLGSSKTPVGFKWELTLEDQKRSAKRTLGVPLGTSRLLGSRCAILIDTPSHPRRGRVIQAAVIQCNGFGLSTACSTEQKHDDIVAQLEIENPSRWIFLTLKCVDGFRSPDGSQ